MLTLNLFGGFQLSYDGQPVEGLGGDKGRALLAYLALVDDRPHERYALAALLWPEIPDSEARNRLRVTLSRLRSGLTEVEGAVGAEIVLADRDHVRLNPEIELVADARLFSDLLYQCERHGHRSVAACSACRDRLEQAVALYKGDFLKHFSLSDSITFEEWMSLNQERYQLDVLRSLEVLADYHLRRGDNSQAASYARRQLDLEPWRETAHRQLIHALALGGQRGAAMAQYQSCQRIMEEEFGASPSSTTTALYERIQRAELGTGHLGPGHNLPAPTTPLVGRQEEMKQVLERIDDPSARLVTLSGPGGVGKSRLAVELAWEELGNYVHGVWWVSYATLPEGDDADTNPVVSTLASALAVDFSTQEDLDLQVRRYLRERNILLVFDNFENLVESHAQWVAQLLREALNLTILVTSRRRLNLPSEWVLSLSGLPALPESVVFEEGEELPPAVQLFYERAAMAGRQLPRDKASLGLVAKICLLLQGLPLGVELAAAWAPLMSLEDVARAIEGDLDFLTGERPELTVRHRSLRAVFNSSWERLSTSEKRALAGLGIFKGKFERAAAEEIVGIGREEISALEQRSLLQVAGDARLSLHARLRGYAREQINTQPDLDDLLARHARYFLGRLAEYREILFRKNPLAVLETIRANWDEIRSAWFWALEASEISLLAPCVTPLARFERLSGWSMDVMRLMGDTIDTLAQYGDNAEEDAICLRIELLLAQVELTRHRGEFAKSLSLCQQALDLGTRNQAVGVSHWAACQVAELYTELGDLNTAAERLDRLDAEPDLTKGIQARLLFAWGILDVKRGDYNQANQRLEDALAFYQGVEDALMELSISNWLSGVKFFRGLYVEALRLSQNHLDLARSLGDRFTEADALRNLGLLYLELGDLRRSRPYLDSALALSLEIRDTQEQAENLLLLGRYWQWQGDLGNAHHYLDRASLAFAGMGLRFNEMEAELTLGEVYLQAGHNQVASDRLNAALEYFDENPGNNQVSRARAGLAQLALAGGETDQALDYVRTLMPELDRLALPLNVHLVCIRTLVAHNDGRAAELLERTQSLLQSRSEHIEDANLRRSYLEVIPAHSEIMTLVLP
jgi:DNA-binding SARP family transcriptional activator/predicted ATPase